MKFNIFTPILILATSAFVLFSCQKTIEFDGEIKKPKIVVNCLFNTEDTFEVGLSTSLSVIDTGSLKPIDAAHIKIYDDQDNLVSTLNHVSQGFYRDETFKPLPNTNYTIDVASEGFTSVKATDKTPIGIKIKKWEKELIKGPDGFNEYQISITFNDPIGRNGYMVSAIAHYSFLDSFTMETSDDYFRPYISSIDPSLSISAGAGSAYYSERLIFDDRNFDGNEYVFRFNVEEYFFIDEYLKDLKLQFSTLGEPAFDYFVSLNKYKSVSPDDPFSTPVQVRSNVENGFGIFGGATVEVVDLKE